MLHHDYSPAKPSATPQKSDLVGAVMVAGGGIAGMQAALDLANSGYAVYLLERDSALSLIHI